MDPTTRPTRRPTAAPAAGQPRSVRTMLPPGTRAPTRGRRAKPRRPSSGLARWAGTIGLCVAPFVLLFATAAAIGYVKLRNSPISLTSMLKPIERGISEGLGGVIAHIDDAAIALAENGGVEVQLTNLQLSEANGNSIVKVPLASVDLNLASLLTLSVVPQRVSLIEPKLQVTYAADKGVSLSIAEAGSGAGVSEPEAPLAEARSSIVDAGRARIDLARWISDRSEEARRGQDSTSLLREVGVRNATVTLDYEGRLSQWHVIEANVDLDHRRKRSVISGSAQIAGPQGPWAISLRSEDRERTDELKLTATVRDVVPSQIASAMPGLSLLSGIDIPVAVNALATLSDEGDVESANLDLSLDAGRLGLPGTQKKPVYFDAGLLKLAYDGPRRQITLQPSTLRLGASHITLVGDARAVIGRGGRSKWRFDVTSQEGALAADEFGIDPVAIASFKAEGVASPEAGEFRLESSSLSAGGARITLEGETTSNEGKAKTRFEGHMGPMPLATLKTVWPRGLAPAAREWVGKNVTHGAVTSGALTILSGGVPHEAGASANGERMSVAIELADLQMRPSPDAPALTVPRALVRMEDTSLEVTIPDASVALQGHASVTLKNGRFTAVDVSGPRPVGEVEFKVDSPLSSLLALAAQKPFEVYRPAELPIAGLDGKVDGDFKVKMALGEAENAQAPTVAGTATISDVRVGQKIGTLELQGGTINVALNEQSVDATGDLLLNGVIAKIFWQRIFGATEEMQPPLRVKATLDNSDRNQLGLDVNHIVQGDMPIEITALARPGDLPAVHVRADLTGAELVFRDLAWKKQAGRSAFLDFDVGKGKDNPLELQNLKIAGDNIAIEGWAAINDRNDMSEFFFPDFSLNVVSRLEVRGKLDSNKVWNIKAKGSTYDAREFFSAMVALGGAHENPIKALRPAAGVDLEATIANVIGHNEMSLRNVKLKASERSEKMTALNVEGVLDNGKPILALLKRDSDGARVLYAESTDAGNAFKLAGFYKNLIGGRLRLEMNLDGRGAADKSGILWVESFRVLGDPVVAEVITSAGGTGSGKQVIREVYDFDRMRVPFSAGHEQFVLGDSYIRGPIVGATLSGKVDFRSERLNLGGTYIPLQGINSALCAIPLLGALITGPKCEGVVGITFAVNGSMSNPQVLVNPLSMFTPGILREIMQMTNPNQKVQERETPRGGAPADQRTGNSSSEPIRTDPKRSSGSPARTGDSWSSQTRRPSNN